MHNIPGLILVRLPIRWKLFLSVAGPLALVAAGIGYYTAQQLRGHAVAQAQAEAVRRAQASAAELDGWLQRVAQVARSTAAFIASNPGLKEPQIGALAMSAVEQDSLIHGAVIAFAPGVFDAKRLFAPSAYRGDKVIKTVELGSQGIDYTLPRWRWYAEPAKTGKAGWTEPFLPDPVDGALLLRYSAPFESDGHFKGMVSIGIRVQDLQQAAADALGGRRFVIVTRAGQFVVHPDPGRVMHEDLMDVARKLHLPGLALLQKQVGRGGAGLVRTRSFGTPEPHWAVFAPLATTGWTFAEAVSEPQALAAVDEPVRQLVLALSIVVAAGGALVLLASVQITRPLRRLVGGVRQLSASGLVRDNGTLLIHDEVGTLTQAFAQMGRELDAHVRAFQQLAEEREASGRALEEVALQRETQSQAAERAGRELEARSRALQDLAQERDAVRQEAAGLSEERDAQAAEIERLEQEIQVRAEALERVVQDRDAQVEACREISRRGAVLKRELSALREEREARAQELGSLRRENEAQAQALQRARDKRLAQSQTIARMQQEREAQTEELLRQRREVEARSQDLETLRDEHAALHEERDDLAQVLAHERAELRRLRDEQQNQTAALQRLRSEQVSQEAHCRGLRQIQEEQAGLLATEAAARKVLESALEAARRAAAGMLPLVVPGPLRRGDLEVHGLHVPGRSFAVGVVDFFPDARGGAVLMVGEAGEPSPGGSVLAAFMGTLVRNLVDESTSLDEILRELNAYLHGANVNLPVMLFLARYDPEMGEISYANAGYPPPLFTDAAGQVHPFSEARGEPLGLSERIRCARGVVTLRSGEMVVFASPAISRSVVSADGVSGIQGLPALLATYAAAPLQELGERLLDKVGEPQDGDEAADRVLLLVRRDAAVDRAEDVEQSDKRAAGRLGLGRLTALLHRR